MRRSVIASAAILIASSCLVAAPQAAPKFDGGRAYEDLRQLVAIGPRPAGSAGAERTRAYIKQQLGAIGVKVDEQPFEPQTPIGQIKMINLRATIPGPGRG